MLTTPIKALNNYFNSNPDTKVSMTEFAKEIKALTAVDKAELVFGVLAITGDTISAIYRSVLVDRSKLEDSVNGNRS